jgi:hypothetical protein
MTEPAPEIKTCDRIHPWEKYGLGKAPFAWLGVFEDIGPHKYEHDGITTEIGSPGQPMGCCAYCGQGIAECHQIRSADGKQFVVGCDCVRRIESEGSPVYTSTERAHRDLANAKAKARSTARDKWVKSRLDEILADPTVVSAMSAKPSVYPAQSAKGATRLDDWKWLIGRCGMSGRARMLKNLLKELGR